ncbi:chromosome partition protein Smc [Kocuria dechangensis]|uniref:Chromosome partition protein Smc n=1 Tax=Kocuria dechangensis TaxID=1176249 RepID=A0A917H254_9MICC|nr:AAA family ATPase [Kocuria dechangensis]GGG65025.1 chromosome partition protein Smc [Kocuria dechangensis]
MHLKTLTVRGFKSFASATTFEFEPGVTAVVGPNGSGKSNVVDALSWVMGEQGAKSLRGGKMEDVIFAGTAGRAPLGRAHVSLTIDNADGALPIEYSEVTISRTLFRTGGSEYAVNGRACRLLDIQELLSDSGLGREMHVIVGQGQLDRILHATPEERRGFVEEASGILKHRRRKERTLRKLEAMQANLDRLEDLVGELRRRLTPLGRQAEVARRAQRIQYDVRDARARLLADDLVQARTTLAVDEDAERRLRAERAGAEQALDAVRARQADVEARAAQATPALNAARDTWYELTAVRERYRSLASLAAERRRLLGTAAEPADPGRDPDRLAAQAARTREEQARLLEQVEDVTDALAGAIEDREAAEAAARAQDAVVTGLLRAAADRREGTARLTGAVAAARSRVEAAEDGLARLHATHADAGQRRIRAEAEAGSLALAAEDAAAGVAAARAEHERAAEAAAGTRAAAREAEAAVQELLRAHDAQAARAETLRAGLRQPDGTAAVRARHAETVVGAVADLVGVEPGWERAVTAALGPFAEALAVRSHGAAVAVFEALRAEGVGRVHLLVPGGPGAPEQPAPGLTAPELSAPELPAAVLGRPGVRPAVSVLHPGAGAAGGTDTAGPRDAAAVLAGVRALLARTVLTEDPATAARVVTAAPGLTAVTRNGDVLTAVTARGGAAEAAGTLETRAAAERAEAERAELAASLEAARATARAAGAARDAARARAEETSAALRGAERAADRAAAELARVRAVLSSAEAEAGRFGTQVAAAQEHLAKEQGRLREAVDRLEAAGDLDAADDEEVHLEAAARRDALHRDATAARAAETEARLALRSLEEQARAVGSRAASQERAAATERRAREEAARRAERRRLQARTAEAVLAAAEQLLGRVEASVAEAARERDRAEAVRAGLDAELTDLRAANDRLAARLAELTDSVHRDELARTQQRGRVEALEARSLEELGLTPDALVDNYGPHLLIPDPAAPAGPDGAGEQEAGASSPGADDGQDALFGTAPGTPEGAPFVRAQQEKRLRRAEKELASLGKVNPLALEEFAALEERHRFLVEQLEDLKRSRQDLRSIIRDVDEHVERVFAEAYADTAREFEGVFATLFPGGEGRLRLTDPTDMLSTGIEVEARPAGKRIKRLSLLSGGERSLTAIALLVAIFKARPSPFYVMDEVEAALDDRNLGRLLTIFKQLQETSQLIIITHQKRTMEIADALYGVAMRGDGVTTVVGQRLAELR